MQVIGEKLNTFIYKFFEVLGIKLLLIIVSSFFLYIGKIDQSYWSMVVLTITGMRTFNQAMSISKTGKAKGNEFKKEITDGKLKK